ncbi:hypothetical protein [Frigidibacter sp. SD6-1]|uniref:beta strand repeat-containing protein n=1 Tax=Frigidibacter sp. SD6-1 TaxID=3032581 RepID=UPI0024DF904E|nr:hypothetical protein [Frigidibacter sp. SD6-1]
MPARAQVDYRIGSGIAAIGASDVVESFQRAQAEIEAIIDAGGASAGMILDENAAGGTATTTVDANEALASASGNENTVLADASVSGTSGADSNILVAGAQEITGQPISAEVNNVDASLSLTQPGAGSSSQVTDNTISADLAGNTGSQTIQGQLNNQFANTDAGTGGTVRLDPPAGIDMVDAADAGLLVVSAQVADSLSANTTNDSAATSFATVTGGSAISLAVDGNYGADQSIAVTGNTLTAEFDANRTTNGIILQAGGKNVLDSAAGVTSAQAFTDTRAAGVEAATVTAGTGESLVSGDVSRATAGTFDNSSLSVSGNTVAADGSGNTASNSIALESGIRVDAPAGQGQSNTADMNSADLTQTAEGGLFNSTGQLVENANVASVLTGDANTAAVRAEVDDSMSGSGIDADGNVLRATATGNAASGSIGVGGSNSFDAAVASNTMQAVQVGSGDGGTLEISSTVTNADVLARGASKAGVDITDGAISADDNMLASIASANTNSQSVSVASTSVTDDGAAGTSLARSDLADDGILRADAGISAISGQALRGDATAVSVTSEMTGSGAQLVAGATSGTDLSNVSASLRGNDAQSFATGNEAGVSVDVVADTSIDSSVAAVSAQQIERANIAATQSGTDFTATLNSTGGSADNLNIVVGDDNLADGLFEGNSIIAAATGQTSRASLTSEAGTDTVLSGTYSGSVNNLDLGGAVMPDTSSAIAERSVLTEQVMSRVNLDATVSDPTLAASLTATGQSVQNVAQAVDGNRITAQTQGNVATNDLQLDTNRLDMTAAKGGAAGTAGVVATGISQLIDANSTLEADIIASAGAGEAEIASTVTSGAGAIADTSISASGNRVTAYTAGNTATSTFDGTGNELVTGGGIATTGLKVGNITGVTEGEIVASDVAMANGVQQSNSASIDSAIGSSGGVGAEPFEVAASATTTGQISGSTISVDGNTVVNEGRGNVAIASTKLDYNNIDSSAQLAVSQDKASGDVTLGTQDVQLSADAVSAAQVAGSSISVDGNTLATLATVNRSNAALTLDAANSLAGQADLTADSTINDGNPSSFAAITDSGYALATRQNAGIDVMASTTASELEASATTLAGSTLSVTDNTMIARALVNSSTATLAQSGDTSVAAESVLLSDQQSDGAISATAQNLSARATFGSATGTTADSILVTGNASSAEAIGAEASNTLSVASAGTITGNTGDVTSTVNLDAATPLLDTSDTSSLMALQTVDGSVTAGNSRTGGNFVIDQNGASGGLNGDAARVSGNTTVATATGGTMTNTQSQVAGALDSPDQTLIAAQRGGAEIVGEVLDPNHMIDIDGTVTDSQVELSGNTASATATAFASVNRQVLDADVTITGDNNSEGQFAFEGSVGGSVSADVAFQADSVLSASQVLADDDATEVLARNYGGAMGTANVTIDGAISGSSVIADRNTVTAVGQGLATTNSQTIASGASATDLTAGVLSSQRSEQGVVSDNRFQELTINAGATATASTLSASENRVQSQSTVMSASNTLDSSSGTAATSQATTGILGDEMAFVNVGSTSGSSTVTGDRVIASNQINLAGANETDAMTVGTVIGIDVTGAVTANSAVDLNRNVVSAASTGATVTNRLTNTAETENTAYSAILANQETNNVQSAEVTASTLSVDLGGALSDTSVGVAGNILSASSTGLRSSNTLLAAGGAMSGNQASGTNEKIELSTSGTNGLITTDGFFTVANVQERSAGALDADAAQNRITLDVAGAVTDASVINDANTVEAMAVGMTTSNLIGLTSQSDVLADLGGSNSVQIANAQVAGATASTAADVTDTIISTTLDGAVGGTSVSADGNKLLAYSESIAASNAITSSVGTATRGGGANHATLAFNGTDMVSHSEGDYEIASQQKTAVGATTTSTIAPASGSASTGVSIDLAAGGVTDGTVTASDNSLRAIANGTRVANSIETEVGTLLEGANHTISNGQMVGGAVSAQMAGGTVDINNDGALSGSLAVDGNAFVAAATGGSATNSIVNSSGSMTFGVASMQPASTAQASVNGTGNLSINLDTVQPDYIFALMNAQTRDPIAAVTSSVTGNTGVSGTAFGMSITQDGLLDGSASVDGNMVLAQSNGLTATNAISAAATNTIGDVGSALVSLQSNEGAATNAFVNTEATDRAGLSILAGAAVNGTLSVEQNQVMAKAASNTVDNRLSIESGNSYTHDSTNDAGGVVVTAANQGMVASQTSTALINGQYNAGSGTSEVRAVDVKATATGALEGSIRVGDNSLTAENRGNQASSLIAGTVGGDMDAAVALINSQETASGVTQTAAINTTNTLSIGAETRSTVDGSVSVDGNRIAATAQSNEASNRLALDVTGSIGSIGTNQLQSLDLDGATRDLEIAAGDLSVANSQISAGDVVATASLADVNVKALGAVGGSLTLADNALTTTARANSATNMASLTTAGSLDSAVAVLNAQDAKVAASLSSTVTGSAAAGAETMRITAAGAVTGSVDATSNLVQATALTNLAQNSLMVDAANGVGDATTNTAVSTASVNTATGDVSIASSSLSVLNDQASAAAVTSSVTDVETAISVAGTTTGSLHLDGNAINSDARSNYAVNTMQVDLGGQLQAPASMVNSQSTSQTAALNSSVSGGGMALNGGGSLTGAAIVENNRVTANATQNQAFNHMTLNGSSMIGSVTGTATASLQGTLGGATGDGLVLNSQRNAAAANALVEGTVISAALNTGAAAGSINGTARVQDNVILASAAGNVADNRLTVDAVGSDRSDLVMASVQQNTAAISSVVTGSALTLSVGGAATTGVTGSMGIADNSITSVAQGNVNVSVLRGGSF